MAKLGDKYLAGFFDADGSASVVFLATHKYPQLRIAFSQKTAQDEVIYRIHEEFGGSLRHDERRGFPITLVSWNGNHKGAELLNRIRPHTVLKRHYIDVCLDMVTRQITKDEVAAMKAYLKVHRRERALPLPVHPSRRWMAGYLDGDGCLTAADIRKPSGIVPIRLVVSVSDYDTEGVEVIQKQYGGKISTLRHGVKQYQLVMPASKAKEVLSPIWQHMVVKRDQAEFILRCAEMGHFRDGINIKSALKHLKAHPHRLNEPKPDVQALLATVRDLPPHQIDYTARSNRAWETRRAMRQSETCVVVEAT